MDNTFMHPMLYQGRNDNARMLALTREHPEGHAHVADLPYRLCSWAFDNPANVGLWEDERGRLLAWAVLQPPFWTFEYGLHTDAPPDALAVILNWGDAQARTLLDTPYGRPAWFVPVPEGNEGRRQTLEAFGYRPQDTVENPWSQVTLALTADVVLPPCPVRDGYRLRQLRGEAEVPAYVSLHRAVFHSTNMTEGWRHKIIRHPAYEPELDLVVEAQSGELAAFCIAWLMDQPIMVDGRSSRVGQIEPIGVHEENRRHGLAWAILAETVRRLRRMGAETVLVQTDNYRDRAYSFYQVAGFRIVEHITLYRKDFAPADWKSDE